MKKQPTTPIIKLSERFDKQLLTILSKELSTLRSAKNDIIKALKPNNDGLLVA